MSLCFSSLLAECGSLVVCVKVRLGLKVVKEIKVKSRYL